jgi:hypothetical protein
MAHVAYANLLMNKAWAHRGQGSAREVPAEGWAPFRASVESARVHLESVKSFAAADPAWYEVMLSVAMAQAWSRPRFDALLREAVERGPGVHRTYFAAVAYLLPQWHGSAADIEKLADEAVAQTGGAEGRMLYARIYWYLSDLYFRNDIFVKTQASWPRMKQGFEAMVERYPDEWNLSHYAKFACMAHDFATARELFERLGDRMLPDAWLPYGMLADCQAAAQRR